MKIVKNILFTLFLLISLTYLLIVVSPKIFKNFYPFGIRVAVILTGSMEPTLEIDDFVIIHKADEIKVNDIVSYREINSKSEVLHRVIEIDNEKIITKGDANNTEDNPITFDQVTGVYIGKIKYLGKIVTFVTKPIGFSLVITSLVIIMLIPSKKDKEDNPNE